MKRTFIREILSPAHGAGFAALAASTGLFFIRQELAAVPLVLFLLLCAVASFLPRVGFFLPVISRGRRSGREVALTFDDGPDPDATPLVLDLLDRYRLPAAFFVAGVKAERYPALIREILARGHAVGNHSYNHDPLLMLRSSATLSSEIVRAQEALARFGIRPLAFRPPVGITNPRLAGILRELGMDCITFSCRACDFGNRRIRGLAGNILRKVRPGMIVLLHDVAPPGGRVGEWLEEVEKVILGLETGGYDVVSLPQLVGRPVMERTAVAPSGNIP